MKRYFLLYALILFLASCGENGKKEASIEDTFPTELMKSTAVVDVYYFHGTRRCPTCVAVGSTTEDFLNTEFKNELDNGQIVFHDVNFDETENKKLVEELQVSGNTLLLVSKNHDQLQFDNLTSMAFMNALINPASMRVELRKRITEILETNN